MKKTMGFSLDELLEDAEFAYQNDMGLELSKDSDQLKELELEYIAPNPYQPRKNFDEEAIGELAESIKEHGLLQPIVVLGATELASALALRGESLDTKDAKYFLIAGERRLRAVRRLGWSKIKAIIAAIEPTKSQELALIENIQRKDLNPIELALAYESLMKEKGLTQEELANLLHKSRSVIANTLRLLNLSEKTQQLVAEGKISAGHAKVIAGSLEYEQDLVSKVLDSNLSVRECEEFVYSNPNKAKTRQKAPKEFSEQESSILDKLNSYDIKFKMQNKRLIFNLKDEKTLDFIENMLKNYKFN